MSRYMFVKPWMEKNLWFQFQVKLWSWHAFFPCLLKNSFGLWCGFLFGFCLIGWVVGFFLNFLFAQTHTFGVGAAVNLIAVGFRRVSLEKHRRNFQKARWCLIAGMFSAEELHGVGITLPWNNPHLSFAVCFLPASIAVDGVQPEKPLKIGWMGDESFENLPWC